MIFMKQTKQEKQEEEHLDLLYMKRAYDLAQHAYPAPNPQVGAVLVRDGKIIGEGHHTSSGQPHAELIALQDAEKKGVLPDGATLYVTLEPCCHFGKTPPCIDALVVAGVKHVVIGCIDQNPLVNGAGVTALLHAGIRVTVGILGKECSVLYRNFFHTQKYKRPYVTLKAALTLDGKIAQKSDAPTMISSPESRYKSHELRKNHDAILVGIGTILADDPQLNCRVPCTRQPIPIILDSTLRIPLDARVLHNKKTIIATTNRADPKKCAALQKKGFRILVGKQASKDVALPALLRQLPSLGILSVLVEGGAHVNVGFIDHHLVDHLCFFISPKLFGGGVPVFATANLFAKEGLLLKNVVYQQVGTDICVEGDFVQR